MDRNTGKWCVQQGKHRNVMLEHGTGTGTRIRTGTGTETKLETVILRMVLVIPEFERRTKFQESQESVWSCDSGASRADEFRGGLVQGVWQGMWQVQNWPRFVSKVTWVLRDVTSGFRRPQPLQALGLVTLVHMSLDVKMLNVALHYSTGTERSLDIGFSSCAAPTLYSCPSISGAFWGLWGFQKCQKWSGSSEVIWNLEYSPEREEHRGWVGS